MSAGRQVLPMRSWQSSSAAFRSCIRVPARAASQRIVAEDAISNEVNGADKTWTPIRGIHFAPQGFQTSRQITSQTSIAEARAKSTDHKEVSYPVIQPQADNQGAARENAQPSQASLREERMGVDEPGSESTSTYPSVTYEYSHMQAWDEYLCKPAYKTPYSFQICEKRYKTLAESMPSDPLYFQHSLYRSADDDEPVKVHYCKSKDRMEEVSKLFLDEPVIGFDLEWMAFAKASGGVQENVSLIQIASDKRVALFHLARFTGAAQAEDYIAPTFRALMNSVDTIKTGVAIKSDATRLRNFLGVESQGLFELSHLHKLVKHCSGTLVRVDKVLVNLAAQVQYHLGLPLLKSDVQVSDWSQDLDAAQTKYAASDPYACVHLYYCMEAKRLALDNPPPRPAFAERNEAIRLVGGPVPAQDLTVVDDMPIIDEIGDDDILSSSEFENEMVNDLLAEIANVSLTRDAQTQDKEQPSDAVPVSTSRSKAKTSTRSQPAKVLPSPEYDRAEAWAIATKASQPEGSTLRIPSLRAYYLWHNEKLDDSHVAKILRDPPLKQGTVISYICDAVFQANLPCDPERVLPWTLVHLPVRFAVWQKVLKKAPGEVQRRRQQQQQQQQQGASHNDTGWWNR